MSSIQDKYPELCKLLQNLEPVSYLKTEETPGGDPTLRVTREENEIYLHSQYNPREEARNLVSNYEVKDVQSWFVTGFGLAYHLDAIHEKLRPRDTVYVFEKDPQIIRKALESRDLSDLFQDGRFLIYPGLAPERLYPQLRGRVRRIMSDPVHLLYHQPSESVYPEYYKELRKQIQDFVEAGQSLMKTGLVLPRRTMENQFMNIPGYLKSPGIRPFENRYENVPGFLISAGPSLEKNIQQLQTARQKGIMFSVGTALLRLLDMGIKPDFTGIVDYHRMSGRYYEDIEEAEDIFLIADPQAAWEAIEKYSGPVCFFEHGSMAEILGRAHTDNGKMDSGSTVAHLGLGFLKICGCDPIVLVGQDLAYPYNISHVPGTAIYDQWLGEMNRFQTYEMKEMEFIQRLKPSLKSVSDIKGNEIYTDDNMFQYLKDMELLCESMDADCIDATEGGARIEGTTVSTLQEALSEMNDLTDEIQPGNEMLPDNETILNRFVAGWEELDALKNRARKLFEYYSDVLERLNELESLIEKGESTGDTTRQILRAHEKLKRFKRLYSILKSTKQAADLIREKDDRRIEALELEGREKQKEQIKRNRTYIKSLRQGLTYIRSLIRKSMERLTTEIETYETKNNS